MDQSFLATYLCEVADSSPRPKSVLNGTLASMACMCDALGLDKEVLHGPILQLVNGLIKSSTMCPMVKTPIMPTEPFRDLFMQWPVNEDLTIKNLRIKVICLMALAFMLRPSDVAPHGQYMDTNSSSPMNAIFSCDQLKFHEDGSLSVSFHAIKNDMCHDGFTVTMPRCSEPKLDVALALQCYISRTEAIRSHIKDQPVFVSLQRPYKALHSTAIASVLGDAIKAAGLSGYTAKNFRPTAASLAIAKGMDPDIARHIGRWRSQEVFNKHYVHTRVPENYLDEMLCKR